MQGNTSKGRKSCRREGNVSHWSQKKTFQNKHKKLQDRLVIDNFCTPAALCMMLKKYTMLALLL